MFISFITKYLLLLSIVTLDSSNVVFFYLITAFKSEGYREFFCFIQVLLLYIVILYYIVLYLVIYLYYIWYRLSFLSKSILLFIEIHCTIWGNGLNCGILWYIMLSCYLYYIISILSLYYLIYIIIETLFTPHSQLSFIFL